LPQSHVSRLLAKYHRRSVSLLQMADPVVGLLTEDADGQFHRWGVNAQRQRSVSLVVLGEIYMSVRALSLCMFYKTPPSHYVFVSSLFQLFNGATSIVTASIVNASPSKPPLFASPCSHRLNCYRSHCLCHLQKSPIEHFRWSTVRRTSSAGGTDEFRW